ncbi:MAG: tyrosine-type recombinase/integrase, partial [Oscillospiraceae bacterium]|nr:tyrosine-type recombinase/integrase [Oscillospiraceae bacterium]
KPKTKDSNRVNCITPQLKQDLFLRKQQIEKDKAYYGDRYQDENLVFCFEDGRPVEPKRCAKWFKVWQERTGLDLETIVFHGIRHSSATYFLGLSDYDVKTVQNITGHGTASQLTDGYAHMVKGHKQELAKKFAADFYGEKPEATIDPQEVSVLLELLQTDPEMRKKVADALSAQTAATLET